MRSAWDGAATSTAATDPQRARWRQARLSSHHRISATAFRRVQRPSKPHKSREGGDERERSAKPEPCRAPPHVSNDGARGVVAGAERTVYDEQHGGCACDTEIGATRAGKSDPRQRQRTRRRRGTRARRGGRLLGFQHIQWQRSVNDLPGRTLGCSIDRARARCSRRCGCLLWPAFCTHSSFRHRSHCRMWVQLVLSRGNAARAHLVRQLPAVVAAGALRGARGPMRWLRRHVSRRYALFATAHGRT